MRTIFVLANAVSAYKAVIQRHVRRSDIYQLIFVQFIYAIRTIVGTTEYSNISKIFRIKMKTTRHAIAVPC